MFLRLKQTGFSRSRHLCLIRWFFIPEGKGNDNEAVLFIPIGKIYFFSVGKQPTQDNYSNFSVGMSIFYQSTPTDRKIQYFSIGMDSTDREILVFSSVILAYKHSMGVWPSCIHTSLTKSKKTFPLLNTSVAKQLWCAIKYKSAIIHWVFALRV